MAPRWATVAELVGEKLDRLAGGCGQGCILGQGQQAVEIVDTLGDDDPELAQMGADRVRKLRLLAHKEIPCAMGQQHRLLILGFDRHKAHVGPGGLAPAIDPADRRIAARAASDPHKSLPHQWHRSAGKQSPGLFSDPPHCHA